MTPKAALAFDAYIAMGPTRSIRGLAARFVQRKLYKNSAAAERVFSKWSSDFCWQARIASAATALADARLEQASELDAASFLRTSELISETLEYTTRFHLDSILSIRQAVRKPVPKSASINVNVIVADLVQRYGLTDDEAAAFDADLREHFAASKVGA